MGSPDGLGSNCQQAITGINDDPVHWRILASSVHKFLAILNLIVEHSLEIKRSKYRFMKVIDAWVLDLRQLLWKQ